MISEITHIGKDAISTEENILILFGEDASTSIKDVSILQAFKKTDRDFELQKKDKLVFGNQEYDVEYVGENVSANLRALGHVTLVFKEFDHENYIETSVYLSPYKLPEVQTGMEIKYLSN